MRLFLDSSVVLAACGRVAGASHTVFELARGQGWRLLTVGYGLPVMKPGDFLLRERAAGRLR